MRGEKLSHQHGTCIAHSMDEDRYEDAPTCVVEDPGVDERASHCCEHEHHEALDREGVEWANRDEEGG